MEYDVTFMNGVTALRNARSCRIRSLAPESSAVLLLSLEEACPPLLLGRPHAVVSGFFSGVTASERVSLGLSPEGGEEHVEVFCRMGIPGDDPLAAGFDLSRRVLAAPSTGRALEVMRPGGSLVALRGKRA